MRTRNSSWSAKAHTFVIAVQLPQQQQFDSDRTVERERGSPAHCNLLFSLLFLIVDDGIWASQYHVKRGHMTVDAAIEAIAASLKDPKDLLVLFLHSSISFFFFWCSLFSFSETVCQVFLFLLFIKPRDTSSQLPHLFCFSLRFQFLGYSFCLWELRISAYWLTWASWLEALDVWIVTARSNAGPFFGGSRQQWRRPWKRMVGRSDSSSSMILQVMLSILMMVVAIWVQVEMHSNMVIRIPTLISFRRAILSYGSTFCG